MEQKCPPLNVELPKLLNEVACNKAQMKPYLQQEVVSKEAIKNILIENEDRPKIDTTREVADEEEQVANT